MNNKTALLVTYVFTIGLFAPVFANAQDNTAKPAKVVVSDDLQTSKASKSNKETSLYQSDNENDALNKRVSVNVNNMSIGTFLSSIARQSKINFIMDDNSYADKKVTASLRDVTAKEALDTLLRVQGLTYQRIGKSDNYVITKRSNEVPDLITKVFTLNYVSLQPQSNLSQDLKNIMPADSTSTAITNTSSGSSVNVFDSNSANNSGPGFTLGSGSANFSGGGGGSEDGSAILDIIKSVLSNQGRIAVDARTNKLIISDVPEVFPQVEAILAELDVKAPQILIEAQIVEVSKSSGFNVGFDWSITGTFTAGSTDVPWSWFKKNSSGNFVKWFGANNNEAEGSGWQLDFSSLQAVFSAMMSNSEARSLGKPKVITMNNNPAVITSARDAAISTVTKSNDSSNSSYSGVERKTVGLKLTVTPQVNKEGYVTLNVAPSYSDIVSSESKESYDTVTRAVSTIVRVKSGQTIVLGGLLQSSEKEMVTKVPLLGQIPILNWFFSSKSKSKSTTDLVIFLTPTVLSE